MIELKDRICDEDRCENRATDDLYTADKTWIGSYCLPCGAIRRVNTDVFEEAERAKLAAV